MSEYRFSKYPHGIEFYGPGMPKNENYLNLPLDVEAERIARWLALAYAAGRKSKAFELRQALGCFEP